MGELEEKLGSILSNPQMMQQIAGMAQMLSGSQSSTEKNTTADVPPTQTPSIDPGLLQVISGIAEKSGTDSNQQTLLNALHPYLSHEKLHKLEKAMGAARMAGAASLFLNKGGLKFLSSR